MRISFNGSKRAISRPHRRLPGAALTMPLALSMLLAAGCAGGGAGTAPTVAPLVVRATPAATATLTATPDAGTCATFAPGTVASGSSITLPPNTVSEDPNGAAGAGFILECTPGATQASISAFLNAEFAQAGWQRWNPATNDANGCGTEANSFWQWYKNDASGGAAIGWDFRLEPPSHWLLVECSLAYGR